MSMDSRSTRSALFKRAEQLKRWEQSDTNREPSVINGDSRKIKFSAGCVFLAACAAGDKEEVLSLLKKGADIDTTNVDGLSALHQACIDDNLDMVEFLVEHGADVNKGDNEGWTPLHATASCGFVSIAKYLIEQGANVAAVNHDGELPVDIAESDEMEDMLDQQIRERGINAEEARTEEERMMLEDAKNWLSRGRILEKLHPKSGASSLHVAAAKGYIKVMEILLQAGSDVDAQDLDGWTPLHAAAHWGQKEAAKLIVDHFCDMETKNCVGQTAFDVADSQMVSYLEELRKKQSSLSRDSFINKRKNNNNIQPLEPIETRKLRILDRIKTDKEDEVLEDKNKVPDVPQIEVKIQPVPNDQSRNERKNTVSKDEPNRTSPLVEVTKQVPNTPAPTSLPKESPKEEDESGLPSWRRHTALRHKEETPKLNLPLRISDREVQKNSLTANSSKVETPQEVVLRRTQSFEADEKFYRRYLELRAKINAGNTYAVINSPTRSASLKEKHFARRGQVKEDPRIAGSSASNSVPSTTSGVLGTSSSTTTNTSSSSSPSTSPQHTNNQVRSSSTPCTPSSPSKRSPASIFKNFFKSFVPPVRDEESETQRKAHAKRVRETRRSTQGVTLEEIKSAEQLVKKKQQEAAIAAVAAATQPSTNLDQQSQDPRQSPDAVFTVVSPLCPQMKDKLEVEDKPQSTIVSATILTDSIGGAAVGAGERRPSWRLKVNNGSKFMLEDARSSNEQDKTKNPSSEDKPTVKNLTETGEATVTLPLRRNKNEEQDKENDSRSGQATQGVIQRRRRPKRRSTGVVHVDMDEIDPDRNVDYGEGGYSDGDTSPRLNSLESEGEKDKVEPLSRVSSTSLHDDSEKASENGEIDYKKLYEESQCENERLRDKLKKTEDDLTRAKLMSEKVPYVPMRNSLSEAEKREKRAMERKLAEMEEELKQLQKLKADNERLKAENRALTRVVSKLTAAQNATRTT